MDELQAKGTYSEFKEQLDTELKKSVESFVKIGYLLKIARDTEILHESGYPSVVEFAKGEYNLSKDQVSRFIAINDKYSVDGYSDKLQEKYEGYGVAKLAEMLTLPDAVADMIEPKMTRAEIQDIKREVKEEQSISDIEVMLEEKDMNLKNMNLLQKFMHQYFYEHRLEFVAMAAVIEGKLENTEQEIAKTLDVLAPSGIVIKNVRIAGIGKLFLSIKGPDQSLELVNMRTNETEEFTWKDFFDNMKWLYGLGASKDDWEMYYHESFAEKVAPVQPKNGTEIEKNGTENKEIATDNQIPGQMNVNDYPELQPDVDEKVDTVAAEKEESTEKTESDTDSSEKLENVDKNAEIIPPKMTENVEKTEREDEFEDTWDDPKEIQSMAQENTKALLFTIGKKDYEGAIDLVETIKKQVEMLKSIENTKYEEEN